MCKKEEIAGEKVFATLVRGMWSESLCLGKLSWKKNGKKRGHCPLLATPPPKRVKRGHLLSDYRQKCVNGTRDSYCGVKSPFLSDLRLILTHIVVSKDSY